MLRLKDIPGVLRQQQAVGYNRGSCFGSVDPYQSEVCHVKYEPIALPQKSFAEKVIEDYSSHKYEIISPSKWREYILFV